MTTSPLFPSPSSPTRPTATPEAVDSSTTSPEALLAAVLRERLAIIADRGWYERDAAGHLAALMRVSERITAAAAGLPPPLHPQLKHYLERCSYDKALAFLSGTPPSDSSHAP